MLDQRTSPRRRTSLSTSPAYRILREGKDVDVSPGGLNVEEVEVEEVENAWEIAELLRESTPPSPRIESPSQ